MIRVLIYAWGIAASVLVPTTQASEENAQSTLEEVVVIGTRVKGSTLADSLPIDSITAEDIATASVPTLEAIFRNRVYTSGNTGQPTFRGSNSRFVNINIRGLGTARTLGLINGRPYANEVHSIPLSALERVDVLKNGGAVIYGSDAIGGVVNIITPTDYQGHKLSASFQDMDGSDGDLNVFARHGGSVFESGHWFLAWEVERQSEVALSEKSWAQRSIEENPQGGWSGSGNPGSFLPASSDNPATILGPPRTDPNCQALGGFATPQRCFFQFTDGWTLRDELATEKIFGSLSYPFANGSELRVDLLHFNLDSDSGNSASFPINQAFLPGYFIPSTHPGLIDLKSNHPGLFPDVGPFPSNEQGAFGIYRILGVAGALPKSERQNHEWQTQRFGMELEGEFGKISYQLYYSVGRFRVRDNFFDVPVERLNHALDGFGGPNCVRTLGNAGTGNCQYFNPFSTAIRTTTRGVVNEAFDPQLANSPELLNWLVTPVSAGRKGMFRSAAINLSAANLWSLPGGRVSWATGLEWRSSNTKSQSSDNLDRAITPCPYTDPFSIALGHTSSLDCDLPLGAFGFLAAQDNNQVSLGVYAAYGELVMPVLNSLELQIAARYEHYEGPIDGSLNPKLAFSWQIQPWLKLRGSASKSFRGPPEEFQIGRDRQYNFVGQAGGFAAIDIVGNPGLKPEQAWVTNLGLLIEVGRFTAAIDWWRADVEDPLYRTSPNQVAARYQAEQCADGQIGELSAVCQGLRPHIFPLGSTLGDLTSIEVSFVNGTTELTSGVDLELQYIAPDFLGATWTFTTAGSYTNKYEVGDFVNIRGVSLASGGNRNGLLNDGDPFSPKPQKKATASIAMDTGRVKFLVSSHYVGSYEDVRPALPSLARIESMWTMDFHARYQISDQLGLGLFIANLLDEDPPMTSTASNYDGLTHSGFGRTVRLALEYEL